MDYCDVPRRSAMAGGAAAGKGAAAAAPSRCCDEAAVRWQGPFTRPATMLAMQQADIMNQQKPWSSHTDATQDGLAAVQVRQCASPVALTDACLAAEPSAEPSWQRERSTTPEDCMLPADQAPAAGGKAGGVGPITPAAAPSHAAQSPTAASEAATPGGPPSPASGAATQPSAARDAATAEHNAAAAELWRRIHSFMQCVAGSPLIHSALLSLELDSSHPVAAEPGMPPSEALQWTLAQLLALHLKAGLEQARESTLLASLWLLESLESVWRSPATVCLNDYLKQLAVFSQEAVVEITRDWPNSFDKLRKSVVSAQAELLKRLDWCLRLDLAAEVKPCLDLLFQLPQGAAQAAAAPGASSPASARQGWAVRMHRLCSVVQQQALHLRTTRRPSHRRCQEAQVAEQAQLTPTKRKRTRAGLA